MITHNSPTIFCPVCSTGRETPSLAMPWVRIFLLTLLWTVVVGALGFFVSGWIVSLWMAMASGLLCFGISEVYYIAKFKRELICPVCHFDPVLYRRSPEQAKQRCLDSLKMREEIFLAKWQALKNAASWRGLERK